MKKKFSFLFVIIGFLGINLLFNYQYYWRQLISDDSTIGAVHGEVQASEWGMEQIYQKIISFQNPFSPIKNYLYPFGLDIVASDPGGGFFFIFLRPFLSPHQSLAMTVVINLFLANIGMFFLLKKVGFSTLISFLIGLSYGYTVILMPRIGGHPTYTSIYLFPWFFLCVYSFFLSNKSKTKVLSSLGIAFFFVLTLWQNLYFFIILLLSCFSLSVYFLVRRRGLVWKAVQQNLVYFLLSAFTILFLLYPWLTELYKVFLFEEAPKASGWMGANTIFASDLFGFFVPASYNYYYGQLISPIIDKIPFARGIFENLTYPGLIILISYIALIIFRKKLSAKIKETITPFLITSLLFAILTLGPFLRVAGRWAIPLEEGIQLVLPLPFVILHYLPFMNNIRVPGRLIMGFVFFAYIVTAYVLSHLLKNKTTKFKLVFFALFLIIFVIDQRYNDRDIPQPYIFPTKIYQTIQKDPNKVSVLEIPFSVRDGFTYFGYYNAILMATGQLTHGKSIVGGYAGRISDYVKNYYQYNPFFGYIGRLIDTDIQNNTNPAIKQTDMTNWQKLDIEKSLQTIDFLNLKYVIVDRRSFQAEIVSEDLKQLGFAEVQQEGRFSLWQRDPKPTEFLTIDVKNTDDNLFLGMGWHTKENEFRWVNRRSSVMFKVNTKRKLNLNFSVAAFHKEQPVTVYLNRRPVGKLTVLPEMKEYSLPIEQEFEEGINFIHFVFDKGFQPSKIIPGSPDERKIAAKFTEIFLAEP